jgi:beta-lactamase superfamily II metal-dependent hydrolase
LAANGGEKENPPEWLAAISPAVAVIEAEAGNQDAQPADNVVKALDNMPLFRTDRQGTIEIASDGKQLWVSTGH